MEYGVLFQSEQHSFVVLAYFLAESAAMKLQVLVVYLKDINFTSLCQCTLIRGISREHLIRVRFLPALFSYNARISSFIVMLSLAKPHDKNFDRIAKMPSKSCLQSQRHSKVGLLIISF